MSDSTFFGFHVNVSDNTRVSIVVGLTVLAGFSSGLLLCLFSLDTTRLKALMRGPNTKDARRARRVMMLLHKPHWLLVTLLLLEDIAIEMMPLVFEMFLNPFAAIFLSVGIILLFGEIIPQATFVRYALQVSASLAYVVLFMMCLTSPITWPIGKLLDWVVGDRETVFLRRRELRELIRLQEELHTRRRSEAALNVKRDKGGRTVDEFGEENISTVEVGIMLGALSMSENTARDVLTRTLNSVFSLHREAIISKDLTEYIFSKGIEYIPVYDDVDKPAGITRVLEAKVLILLMYGKETDHFLVRDFPLQPLPRFPLTTLCSELFETLQHMVTQVVAVSKEDGEVIGIITMRDIIEFVHQTTFKAEMDPDTRNPMRQMMHSWKLLREMNSENRLGSSLGVGSEINHATDGEFNGRGLAPSRYSSRSHSPLLQKGVSPLRVKK